MKLFGSRRREDGRYCDRGVPELAAPEHVSLLVLGMDMSRRYDEAFHVEVHPPGAEVYRTAVRSGTKPFSLGDLVIGHRVPGLIDRHAPAQVLLLEPPCGPNLPLVEPDMQRVRDERDRRTAALMQKYPAPSTVQLRARLRSTASAVHPLWDALRFRMGLMTTAEARAVLDRVRAEGNDWKEAAAQLNPVEHFIGSELGRMQAACLGHLGRVAPSGRDIDEQPLMTMGLAVLALELHPDRVPAALFERVLRPLVGVCGPVIEG